MGTPHAPRHNLVSNVAELVIRPAYALNFAPHHRLFATWWGISELGLDEALCQWRWSTGHCGTLVRYTTASHTSPNPRCLHPTYQTSKSSVGEKRRSAVCPRRDLNPHAR